MTGVSEILVGDCRSSRHAGLSYGSRLATLILTVLFAIQSVPVILIAVTGRTMFRAGEVVTVLALLLAPAVGQHCPKRPRPRLPTTQSRPQQP